jgi:hypothetical protein
MTEPPSLKVVPINAPRLNDIPEMLEKLAAQIRSGETATDAVVVVIRQEGEYPTARAYGQPCENATWVIGLLYEATTRLSTLDYSE